MTQQRRFTKEFEEEAVRLVQTSGPTQREIAGDLGIGLSTLVRWVGRSRDRRDPTDDIGARHLCRVICPLLSLYRASRYRVIPDHARIAAIIKVIGNHIRTSAMLKNAKEAMIKIPPTATLKIPNCLGINHLKIKDWPLCAYTCMKARAGGGIANKISTTATHTHRRMIRDVPPRADVSTTPYALRLFVLCSIQGCSGIEAIRLCIKVFSGTKPRIPDHRAPSTFRLFPMPSGQLA